ncbi:MAG: hypothetical protein M3362_19140, partial [Acidobacteriota bacterium]|nr:hypothetical protein [Acidobacteriota bacterium]
MRKLEAVMMALCFLFSNFISTDAQSTARPPSSSSADVDRRVEEILNRMTLEEKVDMLGGVDGFFIRDIPRLNLPRLRMADGPIGVRNFGPATTMAGGIALA